MSRTKITSLLVPTLLAAAIQAAPGQDATHYGAQSANQSSSAASVTTSSGGQSTDRRTVAGGGAASAASAASGSAGAGSPSAGASAGHLLADNTGRPATDDPGARGADQGSNASVADPGADASAADGAATKPPRICFKLSGRCVEATKEQNAKVGPSTTPTRVDPRQKGSLNLAAPDVRSVMSAEDLKEPLPTNEQVAEVQESETVAVKGVPDEPDVPGGFGAIWWALNHPSQAWRIIAPVE